MGKGNSAQALVDRISKMQHYIKICCWQSFKIGLFLTSFSTGGGGNTPPDSGTKATPLSFYGVVRENTS
jgi:hypothetical protein